MKNEFSLNEPLQNKIRELCQSVDGPFYVYDTAHIVQNCRSFMDISYANKSIHFALMANAQTRFLRIIKDAGLGVFVNSVLHLELVLSLGFSGEDIVYAASAMDIATMRKAQACGCLVILDSMSQFRLWHSLFPESTAGIRCNIGSRVVPRNTLAGYFIGKESRLGLTMEEVAELSGHPAISGLHSYLGTDIIDIEYFMECYTRITELAGMFPELKFLDFGGGFGLGGDLSKKLDLQAYGAQVTSLMDKLSAQVGRSIKLLLEPGRIIGGAAGYFVCRVTDIKEREGLRLIGVNASVAQFPRPLFYPDSAFHPVTLLQQNPASKDEQYMSSIYGCSTYSRDFLAREVLLPRAEMGDVVVLGYAGSYSAGAYTHFLGFPEADEYYL